MKEDQHEKEDALSTALRNKLLAYSAAAGAVLAVSSPAESAIHAFYPPAPLTLSAPSTSHEISIDMDGDGTDDFTFLFWHGHFQLQEIYMYRNSSMNRFDGSNGEAHRLKEGDSVNALLDGDQATLMRAFLGSSSAGGWGWDGGQFTGGVEGYIGVKFRGHDNRDYNGWILFKGGKDPAHMSGSILGWAYEDSGAEIKAGDDGSKKPLRLAFLPDLNGNGSKEFAILKEAQGNAPQATIVIRDTGTGALVREIPGPDPPFRSLGLTRIDAIDGSGHPWLAILAARDSATGTIPQVKVALRDPRTGKRTRDIFFGNGYNPNALFWLNDLNGNGSCELALLGTNPHTGRSVVQIRDIRTGAKVRTLSVASDPAIASIALWSIPDLDGNGTWELAVLQRDIRTGLSWIKVEDTRNSVTMKTVPCLDPTLIPLGMAWVRDMNGNGYPEQAILAKTKRGDRVVAEIRDMLTGEALNTVSFNSHFLPEGFAAADLFGDKGFELAVLGTTSTSGITRLEIRNPSNGALIKAIPVP